MKNRNIILVVSVILLLIFSGCSGGDSEAGNTQTDQGKQEAEVVGDWAFTVEVIDGDTYEITDEVAEEIGPVHIMAAQKDGDDMLEEQQWTGILLKDLLEYVGVEEYLVVGIEGAEGEARELEPDRVDEERTGFGWMVEGEILNAENGPVQLINHKRGPKWWIKDITSVTVIQ